MSSFSKTKSLEHAGRGGDDGCDHTATVAGPVRDWAVEHGVFGDQVADVVEFAGLDRGTEWVRVHTPSALPTATVTAAMKIATVSATLRGSRR